MTIFFDSHLGHCIVNRVYHILTVQRLFIDARKLGVIRDRVHRELTEAEIERIAQTYYAWRGEKADATPRRRKAQGNAHQAGAGKYEDVSGFCKSATLEEIKGHIKGLCL